MKNSSRSQKNSGPFVDKNIERNGVCCCQQISVHEMWKKQQKHEDARQMYGTEICGQEPGKMERATYGMT